jgi:uncharacterized membrane protein YedE/YeeE
MENILAPLLGGVIIGLAATIMLAFNGKITGISGILGGLFNLSLKDNSWRLLFVLGLIFGGVIMQFTSPDYFQYELKFSYIEAIVAGLLVGVGTRIGSGCTSGHGVCGLARFSTRSLVATCTFMGVAIVTVLIKGLL